MVTSSPARPRRKGRRAKGGGGGKRGKALQLLPIEKGKKELSSEKKEKRPQTQTGVDHGNERGPFAREVREERTQITKRSSRLRGKREFLPGSKKRGTREEQKNDAFDEKR